MKRNSWIGFLLLELCLYISFLLLDLFSACDTIWLKFISILLVAAAGLMLKKQVDDRLIAAALCVTAAADVFLLVLDRWYVVGIMLFILVQFLYALRLGPKQSAIRRYIAALPVLIVLALFWDPVNAFAAVYILLFFVNLLCAGFTAKKHRSKQNLLFFLGLALFFCCDISVGLFHVSSGALWQFVRVSMWGFYLPGQVLILSSIRYNEVSEP